MVSTCVCPPAPANECLTLQAAKDLLSAVNARVVERCVNQQLFNETDVKLGQLFSAVNEKLAKVLRQVESRDSWWWLAAISCILTVVVFLLGAYKYLYAHFRVYNRYVCKVLADSPSLPFQIPSIYTTFKFRLHSFHYHTPFHPHSLALNEIFCVLANSAFLLIGRRRVGRISSVR